MSGSGSQSHPALSVILAMTTGYDEIRTTVRHLAGQTIADRIELLVVAREGAVALPREVEQAFERVRMVYVADIRSLAIARAAAVPAASAPVVAFAEDHSFPQPGWAEALLAAHARGFSGVAPAMANANTEGGLSWVAMFLHFGGSIDPAAHETPNPTASHNMSYDRDTLLELGDELGRRLIAEALLHDELRARGHRLWVEPAAVTRHVNMAYLRPLLQHAWVGGRLYGGLRCSFGDWSRGRRLFYACASPLIPVLRLRRTLREVRRADRSDLLSGMLLPMMVVLLVHAAGEAVGYLLGPGGAETQYTKLELARDRFVRPVDRSLWA